MYLLIDECCGKVLVSIAEALGHTAQLTKQVAGLGRGAEDRIIFDFARRHDAIFVTINRGDFIALASHGREHPGVIVLPSVMGRELGRLFRAVLPVAERVFQRAPNMFVEIDERGRVISWQLP
jgi:predicted nuclease of predicted toxin-antitoxin system